MTGKQLYELFVKEIQAAGGLRMLALVTSFKSNASWESQPAWAKEAFGRMVESLQKSSPV